MTSEPTPLFKWRENPGDDGDVWHEYVDRKGTVHGYVYASGNGNVSAGVAGMRGSVDNVAGGKKMVERGGRTT